MCETLPPDTRDALLRLVLAGGPLPPRRRLLQAHADPALALRAGPSSWRANGCTPEQCARLACPDPVALALAHHWAAHPGHHLVPIHSDDYPMLLRHHPQAPLVLFVQGDPATLWHPGVAVVGSRTPSPSGAELAAEFAAAFARSGLAVVSGLAAGVDARAHEAALRVPGGLTVAVVATGLDRTYPPRHAALQARIAERGAVVSEYPPGTAARAASSPRATG